MNEETQSQIETITQHFNSLEPLPSQQKKERKFIDALLKSLYRYYGIINPTYICIAAFVLGVIVGIVSMLLYTIQ